MKIRRDHEYAHSLEALYALFTDAAEIEAKQEALGARRIRIEECEIYDDGADVRFVRELPADVPGILSKFLQPWNTVTQSEDWRSGDDGRYDAELEIEIANVPVTISGTLELEPLENGCVNHVRMTVDCGIPLVGKTLAEFVGKDCKRLIAEEYVYLTERLDSA
ncbi:MAG: DUF2505 domain-containing protein [Gammaproteobacteria bacterium]|nr:DUF2505 domain-containing protein [Gammaproteobacteria bacterium]